MTYALSAAGLAMVQEFEGFRAEPTRISDDAWVVGFAHVRTGAPGDAVSQDEAVKLLAADLAPFEQVVNERVTQTLNQSQFDALVSFAFSIGAEAFAHSQVLRRVNKGEFVAAACAMDAWRKADVDGEAQIVEALVLRRAAEKAHFLKGLSRDTAPSAIVRAKLDHAASILGAPINYVQAPQTAPNAANEITPAEAPVDSPALNAAQRITQILNSEPATAALLLTRVAPDEEFDLEDEIVTAHARPVSRKIEMGGIAMPIDRRIAKLRNGETPRGFQFELPEFSAPRAFENVGLFVLFGFGLLLTWLAGSMLFTGEAGVVEYAASVALALPGLAATLLAGYGMLRGPQPVLARAGA